MQVSEGEVGCSPAMHRESSFLCLCFFPPYVALIPGPARAVSWENYLEIHSKSRSPSDLWELCEPFPQVAPLPNGAPVPGLCRDDSECVVIAQGPLHATGVCPPKYPVPARSLHPTPEYLQRPQPLGPEFGVPAPQRESGRERRLYDVDPRLGLSLEGVEPRASIFFWGFFLGLGTSRDVGDTRYRRASWLGPLESSSGALLILAETYTRTLRAHRTGTSKYAGGFPCFPAHSS